MKQLSTRLFLEYLHFLGLEIKRTKSSHSSYDYPKGHPKYGTLARPLIVRTNYKEIPVLHIFTNLHTIDPENGKTNFEKWLKNRK
jgi:hypothetical protein